MTRVICIASGKGGVGKTTLASNLALALNDFNKRVLIIDTNLTTPNLGFHMGIPLYPKTFHDLLRGEAYAEEATYIHPSGVHIMPAGISLSDLKKTDPKNMDNVILDLVGNHDIIILDGAAGLGNEGIAGLKAADEVLIVTNPELPAVTDALKTVKIAEEMGTHILGIVLNKHRNQPSELSISEVEALMGYPIISIIPEEKYMQESLAAKTPLVSYRPNSITSHDIKKLAGNIIGVDYQPPVQARASGLFSKIFSFLK
ncbi:MAG: cell division ATPase MinD [DPANN group archaeon]|nr:cell division ATPase MinD [DPANN group archaeon]